MKVRTENSHFILKAEWPYSCAVSPSQAEEGPFRETPKLQGMLSVPLLPQTHSPGAGLAPGRYLTASPQKTSFPTQRKGSWFSYLIQAQLKAQEEERQKKDAEEKQAQLERKREEKRLKTMVSSLSGVCRQLPLLGLTASEPVAPSPHLCAGHGVLGHRMRSADVVSE